MLFHLPGRLPNVDPVHLEVKVGLDGVVRHKAVQVDVRHFLQKYAGVGVHDEAGAVRGVAGDSLFPAALILHIPAGRGRGQCQPVALEVAIVQGWNNKIPCTILQAKKNKEKRNAKCKMSSASRHRLFDFLSVSILAPHSLR